MKWYHWIIIVGINVLVSIIVSNIVIDNHRTDYIHLESMWYDDGSAIVYPDYEGILFGSKYIEHSDDLNPQPDYYKHEERYIDFKIPVYIHVTNFVRTKDGDLINRTDWCYYNKEKIDCR